MRRNVFSAVSMRLLFEQWHKRAVELDLNIQGLQNFHQSQKPFPEVAWLCHGIFPAIPVKTALQHLFSQQKVNCQLLFTGIAVNLLQGPRDCKKFAITCSSFTTSTAILLILEYSFE